MGGDDRVIGGVWVIVWLCGMKYVRESYCRSAWC